MGCRRTRRRCLGGGHTIGSAPHFDLASGPGSEACWSPGIHQQCIRRLDREGQQAPVSAFFLVTDDGSDPPMMDVLGINASEAQHIIDPHLGVEIKEKDTSNLRKLVERYLDRKREIAA